MAGAILEISPGTTVINTLVDSDETINTAINAIGSISNVIGFTTIPISNTKAKLVVLYN